MKLVKGAQCSQDPQLHFMSQIMQNAEFFSCLANGLMPKREKIKSQETMLVITVRYLQFYDYGSQQREYLTLAQLFLFRWKDEL